MRKLFQPGSARQTSQRPSLVKVSTLSRLKMAAADQRSIRMIT